MGNKLLHYIPKDGNIGDCFPLYAKDKYYIYYLKLNDSNQFVWSVAISDDLINIKEEYDVLLPGEDESLDHTLLSGCVYFENDTFYAFYSSHGNNGRYNIMLATSYDGINFKKTNAILFEPNDDYEKLDTWRDPEIFYEDGVYHMLFCAKENNVNNTLYSGCVGHATSSDLLTWTLQKPFYSPAIATTLECPDLFKLDNKYVLTYYWHDTKYLSANSFNGKYRKNIISSPSNFDFMAAKALQDQNRTIEFGWIPRKKCDCAARDWGGTLAIPKEIYFTDQKTIGCKFIDEVYKYFQNKLNFSLNVLEGKVTNDKDLTFDSRNKGSIAFVNEPLDNYLLCSNIEVSSSNSQIIFFIKTECNQESNEYTGYQVILDIGAKKLSIREQYRWDQRPDLSTMPLLIKNKKFLFEMIVNDDILEINIDKKHCLTYRMLKHQTNSHLGISVSDGKSIFKNLNIYK